MSVEAEAKRPRRGRRALIIALIVLGLLVAAAAWVGVRAALAKSEFDALLPLAGEMKDAATAGDLARVGELAPQLEEHADRAAALTGDPIWAAAEFIPLAGPNLTAVRVAASGLSSISNVLPDVIAVGDALAAPADGAIVSTTVLAEAAAPLRAADVAVSAAAADLRRIDTDAVMPQVAEGITRLREAVAIMAPATSAAADAAEVLPTMLGGDGERSILVMIQNGLELRTGGGITGSFAQLSAIDGRLDLVRQADSADFAPRTEPIVPLDDAVTTIYGDGVGRFVQNITMTPDFATSAEMASQWWSGLTGNTPDTVVAVDPFVLRALVGVVGPVDLPSGVQLTSDNLFDILLVQPYLTMTSQEQSEYFSSATLAVFDRLTSGGMDPLALIAALAEPTAEGRIAVWSADEAENDPLSTTALGGTSVRLDEAGDGAFGVYFNDATGGKLAQFLDTSMVVGAGECRADGFADVSITVTMTSTAPADLESWPISVTGGGLFGVGAGDIGTNISVEGPRGATLGAVIVKDEPYAAPTAMDGERPATTARVNLSPAEVNTLEFHFWVPQSDAAELALVHTPLVNAPRVEVTPGACG